jgi:hypothetical protein
MVTLSAQELVDISATFPVGAVAGTRYAQAQMDTVYL